MRLIEPIGLLAGDAAAKAVACGRALWLAGGPLAFMAARGPDAGVVPATDLPEQDRERLTRPHAAWAGLPRPAIMGIVNVTPDSFSDGGDRLDHGRAIAAGLAMLAAGADVLDIGGESTRPGSAPVPPEQERGRIIPVIRALAGQGARISADTRSASTMRAALDAGALIFNDVSALAHDPESLGLAAESGCPVVLMHMRGTPADMLSRATYEDVAAEVVGELDARIAAAEAAGVKRAAIIVDPGIGFAKTNTQSIALLRHLPLLFNLGCPILVGASRKGFIGRLAGQPEGDPKRRVAGSVAVALHALAHGASVLRVHDVAETVQAVRVWQGIAS